MQKKESSSRKQGSKLTYDTVHCVIQECNGTNNLANFYYVFIDQASLEILAMEMTLFKTFDWLIWLSYSHLTSCFIDLMSSSFAVPNKK